MAQNNTNNGIGFTGLLTILFIGLKLAGIITWQWKWVLAPIWISFLLVALIIVIILLTALYEHCFKK